MIKKRPSLKKGKSLSEKDHGSSEKYEWQRSIKTIAAIFVARR